MAKQEKTQLAVLGGGPGGYAAAFMAADLGMDVALVDPEGNPGGVCLYRGCIPSKALLHAARVVMESQEAAAWGIDFGACRVDVAKLRSWKDDVVRRLTGGVGTLAKHRKVRHLQGKGVFRDSGTLEVSLAEGKVDLAFERAILATGSLPVRLPGFPDSDRIWDSGQALRLEEVPGRLLVVGGGYIGLELGTVYAALGAEVSVVEMTSGILPGVDRDLANVLKKRLEKLFKQLVFNAKVAGVDVSGKACSVEIQPEEGEKRTEEFDAVLVSVGRRPSTSGLGLENTDVQLNDDGFVAVNAERRTRDSRIYAVGDVTGQPMLAHKASHEGRIAAESMAGEAVVYEPRAVPAVVYTDPEIAWCGLTESEAKEKQRDVKVARFPWAASGRALTLGRSDGVTKVIVDPEDERILGVGIAGPQAGDLISEAVLAIEMGAVVNDLRYTIHPHPTLSETLMEAADLVVGRSTHYHRRR
ncbi:MAG: dihydrolipoyl dehydrogenase [Candidatus Eisenbacteria bacterium]|nr:dihydrolipoyl dehydrogenase [Candidatus Eisenbacteria bacterium]